MSSLKITFKPIDTLFFRDGSPFNRGELQANISMIFPPSPSTLAGAIRAAWARAMGWDGGGHGGNWDEKCKAALGGGANLANIKFDGCYLFKGSEPLFPAPAHLLGIPPAKPEKEGTPTKLTLLSPQTTLLTDIGEYQLSATNDDIQGRKSLIEAWWMTACGLRQILAGELPATDSLIHQSKLWSVEQRTGNVRDPITRTTQEMALYAPQHIRLNDDVSLVMYAEGLDDSFIDSVQSNPQPVGGESRMCWLDIEHGSLANSLKSDAAKTDSQQIQIALTPIQLETSLRVNDDFATGNIINLCNPRPIMLGGWHNNKPSQLMPHLRAGSVIFLQADTPQPSHTISTHGENQAWGFGRTISGIWT